MMSREDWPAPHCRARLHARESSVLGNLRVGPDLTNVALRSARSNWFHQHLYEPSVITPGSNMPRTDICIKIERLSVSRVPTPSPG